MFVCLHWKNPRFTAFLDSKLHSQLAIVTANELGLAFPPRNVPKIFRPDPSTFYCAMLCIRGRVWRERDRGSATAIGPRTTGQGITASPPSRRTPLDNRSTSQGDGRVKRRAAAASPAPWRTYQNADLQRDRGTRSPVAGCGRPQARPRTRPDDGGRHI